MTTSQDLHSVEFENANPAYFTMIPNIIDYLTYNFTEDDGTVTTRRLSVYAKELYRVLVRIAGDEGACWMGRDKLAEICNMSTGSVTNAKKELLQSFNELEGKPLISLQECKKSLMKEGQIIGATMYHKIRICDIWKLNNKYFKVKKLCTIGSQSQPMTPPPPPKSSADSTPQRPASSDDTNKTHNNKTQLFKEQQPVASATPVCSLDQSVDSVCSDSPPVDQKAQAFNWMMRYGFDERAAMQIIDKHTIEDISLASQYVMDQMRKRKEKNETIANPLGYFVKTIEGRWWRQKKV